MDFLVLHIFPVEISRGPILPHIYLRQSVIGPSIKRHIIKNYNRFIIDPKIITKARLGLLPLEMAFLIKDCFYQHTAY